MSILNRVKAWFGSPKKEASYHRRAQKAESTVAWLTRTLDNRSMRLMYAIERIRKLEGQLSDEQHIIGELMYIIRMQNKELHPDIPVTPETTIPFTEAIKPSPDEHNHFGESLELDCDACQELKTEDQIRLQPLEVGGAMKWVPDGVSAQLQKNNSEHGNQEPGPV